MAKLTEKQRKFVEGKAHGLGHTQAALVAGFAPNSAAVTASQLMKRADIKAAIRAAKKSAGKPEVEDEGELPRLQDSYASPLDFMLDVMNQPRMPAGLRFEAAKQALPYCNAKVGEKGKKESQKERAGEISKGRFSTKTPPGAKLAVVQGGKS